MEKTAESADERAGSQGSGINKTENYSRRASPKWRDALCLCSRSVERTGSPGKFKEELRKKLFHWGYRIDTMEREKGQKGGEI